MPESNSGRGRPHEPRRWRLPAIGSFILVLMLVLAACASGGAAPAPGTDTDDRGAPGQGEAPADGGGGEGTDNGTDYFADLANRQIIKTGEVTLEVAVVARAVGEIRAMALQLGGYVGGSQAGEADQPATLTLRIPAGRFDDALERLRSMEGEVRAEATREEDVTGSVVDLEARIRNLRASEAQYRSLLGQATEIEDILTVQARLDQVRGEIEQLQAQLDQLSDLASLATLTVTVVPASTPVDEATAAWDPGAIFDSAVAALVGLGQALAAAAIWLVILGLPLVAVIGILVWVGLRVMPPIRRRPAPPAEQPMSPGE